MARNRAFVLLDREKGKAIGKNKQCCNLRQYWTRKLLLSLTFKLGILNKANVRLYVYVRPP